VWSPVLRTMTAPVSDLFYPDGWEKREFNGAPRDIKGRIGALSGRRRGAGRNPMSTPYEDRFAEFIQMCKKAKGEGAGVVMVARPEVLGDNYEEIVESLSRLAEAGLKLCIAEPSILRASARPDGGAPPQ